MDLSPGTRRLPNTLRAGRMMTDSSSRIASFKPAALSPRLRFRLSFPQRLARNFADAQAKLELGRRRTAAPAVHLPVRTKKLRARRGGQVRQQRILAYVEVLRKRGRSFRLPGCAVSRGEQGYLYRLLFDHVGDRKRHQENRTRGGAHVQRRAVALGGDNRFFRYEESIEHNASILRQSPVASCQLSVVSSR